MSQQGRDLTGIHREIQAIHGRLDARRGGKFFVQINNIDTFIVRNLKERIKFEGGLIRSQ